MNNKGFTMLELLIGMAIAIIIVFFIISFAVDITDYTLRFSGSLFTQQQLQQTLNIMVPEIRSAGQSNTGAYPIETATSTELVFYSDIDRDGIFEKLRYFLNGSTFTKGVTVPSGAPLVYNPADENLFNLVDNMIVGPQIFSYFDSSATSTLSTQLPNPIDILAVKMIRITLVANQGSAKVPAIVGVEDQVTIRNLRYQ